MAKKRTTAFGWLEEIGDILYKARRDIENCVAEIKNSIGVEVDFVDEKGQSIWGVPISKCVQKDERGDMVIHCDRIPANVVAIKITQRGEIK